MTIVTSKQFYIDERLKQNIDVLLDSCKEDDDFVMLVDGPEGAGKSKFMRQLALYCAEKLNSNFSVDNIFFSLNDYVDFSIQQPFYTPLILDESRKILSRQNSNSKEVRKFTDYMSECRKKRQIHIIGIPAFHDLNKYIVLWRAKILIHVLKFYVPTDKTESGFKLQRGTFKLFVNDEQLKTKYLFPYQYPKKYESYGKFPNVEVVDIEEYEKKKDLNLEIKFHSKYEEQRERALEKKYKKFIIKLTTRLNQDYDFPLKELASFGGWEMTQLKDFRTKNKEEEE